MLLSFHLGRWFAVLGSDVSMLGANPNIVKSIISHECPLTATVHLKLQLNSVRIRRMSWPVVTDSKGLSDNFFSWPRASIWGDGGGFFAKEEVKYLPKFKRHALLAFRFTKGSSMRRLRSRTLTVDWLGTLLQELLSWITFGSYLISLNPSFSLFKEKIVTPF